jgi:hypothetical protein
LYDRRRALGLRLARGRIVAMTEDHAVPSPDWVQQLLEVHEQPYTVIGGAIENAIDRPLHDAVYFCDFGRYGRPLTASTAAYVSDVNVSYKRDALMAIEHVWRESYHETTTHWALAARGDRLYLDPRLVVHQHRPPLPWRAAFRERLEWGRAFAETRVAAMSTRRRFLYGVCAPALLVLMLWRVWRHMRRQQLAVGRVARSLPVAAALLVLWTIGEFTGYVAGSPLDSRDMSRLRQGIAAN